MKGTKLLKGLHGDSKKKVFDRHGMHDKNVGPLGFHPWKHNGPFDGIQDWMGCVFGLMMVSC